MSNLPDHRRGLRLDHAQLVSPNDHNAIVGMAWDAYLEIAARLEPEVLTTLLTKEALDAPIPRSDLAEETVRDRHIEEWCQQWGFDASYASNPAWNTLNAACRAQGRGEPLPDTFVCTWSGTPYPEWLPEDLSKVPGGVGMQAVGDDEEGWNPDGTPHPFPELEGRLLAHYHFQFSGGNGMSKMYPDQANRMGTQVLLDLPLLYWEPTAETREEARTRILGTIAECLETDLEKIELAYRAHGYRTPPEKRTVEHLAWLFRFQVQGESQSDIANADGVDRAGVTRAVNQMAKLLGLTLREEKGGRPKKKHSRTIRVTNRREMRRTRVLE